MEMRTETVDLDIHLPALLFALGSKISQHANKKSARPLQLDMCEWRVVQILGRDGPSSINQVADRIAMDRGGTSRAISRLEKRGLILRDGDPADRRRSKIRLTGDGVALQDEIAGFANQRERQLTASLQEGEKDTLVRLLKTLDSQVDALLADSRCGLLR